jgi:virulence factor Mce-like protein
VPVTVESERAGLVMNPEAKVKMRGVQVGQVESIEPKPGGGAVLHLAMYPAQLQDIPNNVDVNITSSTVFGAKFVELVAPSDPSSKPLASGQRLTADHVTVETNTVFQQLTSVLKAIDPVKLNETLGAISGALNGRGEKLGQTVTDFDHYLKNINPSLGNINRDLELAPVALNAYADRATDLVDIIQSTTTVSNTLVDQEKNLDAFLVSAIGLADTGNDVIGGNRQALTDDLRMLVPTTRVLGLEQRGWRRETPQDAGVQSRIERVVAGCTVVVELDPGIAVGDPDGLGDQTLEAVYVHATSGRQPFAVLGPVGVSEVIRDLRIAAG